MSTISRRQSRIGTRSINYLRYFDGRWCGKGTHVVHPRDSTPRLWTSLRGGLPYARHALSAQSRQHSGDLDMNESNDLLSRIPQRYIDSAR